MSTGHDLDENIQNPSGEALLEKLVTKIEANLNNNQFGVDSLAQSMGMSRSSLHRKLHKTAGISTSQFIREHRLKRALEILKQEDITASEVAYRVGFSSATYFNTCFHKFFGYTPGDVKYRVENTILPTDTIPKNKLLPKGWSLPTKITLIIVALLGLLLMGLYLKEASSKTKYQNKSIEEKISSTSIAILPFKNLSDDKESEYFAAGVAQSIQSHLNKITGIKLISETSMAQYEETTKTSPEIAAELNVSYLLEASIQEYEEKVRVIVKLIDAKKDAQIWSDSYDRDLVDIFHIQSEISKQIASELEVVLSPVQIRQIDRIPTNDIEAYNLYQKGKHFFNLKDHSHGKGEKSIHYFKQAIERDPEFALAHAALATSYLFSGENLYIADSVELVEKLALKAIALDNSISEAHVALGTLACMYEWDWEKARKEYEQAIQLNPNNSNAYIYYSQYLFSVKGEFQEARKQINMALSLDPLSYVANLKSAQYYFHEGNYDKTLEETSKLKEINKYNMYSYWINFQTYESLGMKDIAVFELLDYYKEVPTGFISVDSLKISIKNNGLKGVYKYYVENNLLKLGSPLKYYDFLLYADAQGCAKMGNNKKALEYLKIAFLRRCNDLYQIKYDPFFKILRSDPEFLAILDKMNLGDYK